MGGLEAQCYANNISPLAAILSFRNIIHNMASRRHVYGFEQKKFMSCLAMKRTVMRDRRGARNLLLWHE